jgi:hypothetical protein
MTTWTTEDLSRVGEAEEIKLATARADGSLRPYVTMWVVRADDELYVRSAYGPDNPWFRRAKISGAGRIRAGGQERDVAFAEPSPGARRHRCRLPRQVRPIWPQDRRHCRRPQTEAVTIRLLPRTS